MSVKPIDINPNDLAHVQAILDAHLPTEAKVWVFGSRATWTTKDSSDLDLAIDLGRHLTRQEECALADAFDESDLAYKVDIVDMQTVSESFKKIIERDMVELERGNGWNFLLLDNLKADTKNAFAMGPFGSNIKADSFAQTGVPIIKGGNLNNIYLIDEFSDYLTHEKANKISSSIAQRLDLVITHRGTLGQVGIIPIDSKFEKYIVSQSQLKLEFNKNIVNPYFIYYFLRSTVGQKKLLENTSQVGVPAIAQALTSIRRIKINIPNLNEQCKIVDILKSIDDLIILLRETNTTLESIAQTLFKSWFINFDPVHAKQQGRLPDGMDAETAALFPDSFATSELGEIPKGWSVSRIDQFIELAYGKALKSTDRISGHIPVYGSGGVTGYHNQCLVNGPSIIVGRKGTVGTLYWEDRNFFPIDTVFFVKTSMPLTYCYYLLQTLGLKDMNTDAAVPGLNRNNVYRLVVPHPDEVILKSFDNIVKPIRDQIFNNTQQAQTLAKLRDALLPRLISGQLRIKNNDETYIKQAE